MIFQLHARVWQRSDGHFSSIKWDAASNQSTAEIFWFIVRDESCGVCKIQRFLSFRNGAVRRPRGSPTADEIQPRGKNQPSCWRVAVFCVCLHSSRSQSSAAVGGRGRQGRTLSRLHQRQLCGRTWDARLCSPSSHLWPVEPLSQTRFFLSTSYLVGEISNPRHFLN